MHQAGQEGYGRLVRAWSLTRVGLEFVKVTQAISVGFVIMGVIGYTIKLVHIPINNIIVYAARPVGHHYGF